MTEEKDEGGRNPPRRDDLKNKSKPKYKKSSVGNEKNIWTIDDIDSKAKLEKVLAGKINFTVKTKSGDILFRDRRNPGFWNNNRYQSEVVNNLKDDLAYKKEKIDKSIKKFFDKLATEKELNTKIERPLIKKIKDWTEEKVEKYPSGEETWYIIQFNPPKGGVFEIELTKSELVKGSAKFRIEWLSQRDKRIKITKSEWQSLCDFWLDSEEIDIVEKEKETISKSGQICKGIVKSIPNLKIYADEKKLTRGNNSAWYDTEEEVVYVQNEVPKRIAQEENEGSGYLGEVSKELRRKGIMLEPTCEEELKVNKGNCWPFDPEKVNVTEEDIIKEDEDDDELDDESSSNVEEVFETGDSQEEEDDFDEWM